MSSSENPVNADIVFACEVEKFFHREIILEDHALVRMISGEMRIVQAEQTYVLGAGATFLLPRDLPAAAVKYPKDGQPYKSISINLKPQRLEAYYRKHTVRAATAHDPRMRLFDKHLLLDSLFASLLPYLDLDTALPEALVAIKVEEAISVLRTVDESVDRVLAYFGEPGKIDLAAFMEKNFVFNMPLDKFAYLTGRSLTTFKRDFKKTFDTPPQQWLTRKRLEHAHYQLTEKNLAPVDVCFEVGFQNLSHFSYAFKKQFGYGPATLRNKA